MRNAVLLAAALLLAVATPRVASAQLLDTKMISLAGAKNILAAAEAEAERNNWNVAIVVVDAGGQLIAMHKRDGTQAASIQIAIDKARTAAKFRRPTAAIQQLVAGGTLGVLNVDDVMPIQGGLPVLVNNIVIGAVGVSGVTAAQDEQVAQAGLNALQQ